MSKGEALVHAYPGNKFELINGQLNWYGPDPEPTQGQIDAAVAQYEANKHTIRANNIPVRQDPLIGVLLDILLEQENRIRALEGDQSINQGQFDADIRSRLAQELGATGRPS
jgi:hypothetical protein